MNIKAQIKNGKFEVIANGELAVREQNEAPGNIKTLAEFRDSQGQRAEDQIAAIRKAGRTEEQIENALFVLAFPVKRSGPGQYVAVTVPEVIAELKEIRAAREASAEAAREAAENSIEIRLSSRGWGDYSALTVTVDRRSSDAEILAACKEALANGHDVDQPNQSDAELLAKIADARGAEARETEAQIKELEARIDGVDRSKLVATGAEARAAERRYNDLHNEGGEGYVPHIMSEDEYDSIVEAIAQLKKELA